MLESTPKRDVVAVVQGIAARSRVRLDDRCLFSAILAECWAENMQKLSAEVRSMTNADGLRRIWTNNRKGTKE